MDQGDLYIWGEMDGELVGDQKPGADGSRASENYWESGSVGEKVQVKFTTQQPEYAISIAPILVPTRFRRCELSEIINGLLESDHPIVFEFAHQRQVIQGTLGSHISKHNLTTENVLEIEYFSSGLRFTRETVCDYEDWISCISISDKDDVLFSSSFGGEVCMWDLSGNILARLGTGSQINKILCLSDTKHLVYGCENCDIEIGRYNCESKTIVPFLSGELASPVTALQEYKDGTMFISGCWNGGIHIWDILLSRDDLNTPSESILSEVKHRSKRKRILDGSCPPSTPAAKSISPLIDLPKQHTAAVACISTFSDTAYSGGHDRKIIKWDLCKNTWIHSTDTNHSVLCMDANPALSALVTGHSNNSIKIHDVRTSREALDISSIARISGKTMHSSWVSCVKWASKDNASHPYAFASASYDGTVKTWDIRALSPVNSIRAGPPNSKIFALSWVPPSTLAAGGQECKLKLFH